MERFRSHRGQFGWPQLVVCTTAMSAVACLAFAGSTPLPQPGMGEPLQGLTQDQLNAFLTGRTAFQFVFTQPTGLGPVFNQSSCAACHNNPVGGSGSITVTRFGVASKGSFDPLADWGGSLLQAEAISDACEEVLPTLPDLVTTQRATNSALGLGLVESILDADIEYHENNPPDSFVSGRVHWVTALEDVGTKDEGTLYAGRMGWKAQVATVLTFSGDASKNELGFTNRLDSVESDPNGIFPPNLGDPDFCDTVADPEDNVSLGNGVDKEFIDVITDFQRFLAPPPQTPRSGMTGEAHFAAAGCTNCHVASFTTPDDPALEDALRNKVIKPYGDFLLHDMGLLGDGIEQGDASTQEIRTPSLWGIRKRDPMLHNASVAGGTFVDRINSAVAAHNVFGSEAANSAAAFLGLPTDATGNPVADPLTAFERDQVIDFLDSLGQREFDTNGDNFVNLQDFPAFHACYGGGPYTADDPCAIHDLDQDGDVDLDDYDGLLLVYIGPPSDCNNNQQLDITDIILGESVDANNNGIPDECEVEPCLADIAPAGDPDGTVGAADLGELLANWGDCPMKGPCPADIAPAGNPDGTVGAPDLGELLANWGKCK